MARHDVCHGPLGEVEGEELDEAVGAEECGRKRLRRAQHFQCREDHAEEDEQDGNQRHLRAAHLDEV